MPEGDASPDLGPVIRDFVREQRRFTRSPEGIEALDAVNTFDPSHLDASDPDAIASNREQAQPVIDWLGRMPTELVDQGERLSAGRPEPTDAQIRDAAETGLRVIDVSAHALLAGARVPADWTPGSVLHVAFSGDPAAAAVRTPFQDDSPEPAGFPEPPLFDVPDVPDLLELARDTALWGLLQTFADCGGAAADESAWLDRVRPIGRVVGLDPSPVCGNGRLTISYRDFGPVQPPDLGEIVVSLPTVGGGAVHRSVKQFDPGRFVTWRDSGTFTIDIPEDIVSGPVGFFALPTPLTATAGCSAGSLAGAAADAAGVLGDLFGSRGAAVGLGIFNHAAAAELARNRALPGAAPQPDGLNLLRAGPPRIDQFWVDETAWKPPHGSVTLHWDVSNADEVRIIRRSVPGSQNPHELNEIAGLLPSRGLREVPIPCTRRWEGQYVLQASNANGCATMPIEAGVRLRSMFSEYRFGAAKHDVTDYRPGLGMAGFAYTEQRTAGVPQSKLFARAFVIEENTAAAVPHRVVIVVADIWTCTQAVKSAVVERLNAANPSVTYRPDNILISGTHTHSGPGGYSHYFLYNYTSGGFDQLVFDTIVEGIVLAIRAAELDMYPGRILVNSGDVVGCGGNRSVKAYQRNAEFETHPEVAYATDSEMLLLRFERDVDNAGTSRPIGALNWFAVHPTSLGMYNSQVSGDSKGHAEAEFESRMPGSPNFVAAFGNANAGDISGNVVLDANWVNSGSVPIGGKRGMLPEVLAGDIVRMEILGKRQCERAMELFNHATEEVSGPIASCYTHVDMDSVQITGSPGARTWPAAIGVSFGAGSSEDSEGVVTQGPPTARYDLPSGIIEGMTVDALTNGTVKLFASLAWPFLLARMVAVGIASIVPGEAAALVTGTDPTRPAMEALIKMRDDLDSPNARARVSSWIAEAFFPKEVGDRPPLARDSTGALTGIWRWTVSPPPTGFAVGHGAKPVMFPVGLYNLEYTSFASPTVWEPHECPLVPHRLPLQLLRIGSVAIAGVPSEFTSTAGRRLKARVKSAFGGAATHVAIAGYANAYSGYVTTPEEYGAQHYEGASTLYGPHTLDAYLQTFDAMVADLLGGTKVAVGAPFEVPAFHQK